MIVGIGIDIIEIKRIDKAIKRWGNHFLKHIFVEEEIQYAQKRKYPAEHYAGKFAAKEAVYKAMDNIKLGWKDIIIRNEESGKPYCILCDKHFKGEILISISHSHEYAIANATVTQ